MNTLLCLIGLAGIQSHIMLYNTGCSEYLLVVVLAVYYV
jgi:hypothetical protein